jgi:beta-galactosidase
MMMMWGQAFGALRIVGKINGEQVAEQKISSDGVPKQLIFEADFTELVADGADMTRVVMRITDEFGNTLPYAQNAVMFETEFEPADVGAWHAVPLQTRDPQLIGENPLVLPGGQGAVYLRAGHTAGIVTITAKTAHFEPQSVTITLN